MPVAIVFLLRAVVLILLWGFVIAAVVAVRHDVFATKASRISPPVRTPKPAAPPVASAPKPAPAPARRAKASAAVPTRVTVVEGPNAGISAALSSLPVTIGRAADANIVLTDDYVSHSHAQLVPRGKEWLITDTGSTNGTFIGNTKVTAPTVVPVGGRIRIGTNVLELQA